MEFSNKESKNKNKDDENVKSNTLFENIKGDYFLQKLYDNLLKKKKLEIVKLNKKMQKRLNLNINDYKEYSEIFTPIEIEIRPAEGKFGKFININENDKLFYHIYFNDAKKEIKDKYIICEEDKVTKIIIILDFQVISFKNMFSNCKCIEFIHFKKFYRTNITDMSYMLSGCTSLKELNLTNFNTNNVSNMAMMFFGCSSLKELNLSIFNTNNMVYMNSMFSGCLSLKKLNLSNFILIM